MIYYWSLIFILDQALKVEFQYFICIICQSLISVKKIDLNVVNVLSAKTILPTVSKYLYVSNMRLKSV